MKHLKQKIAALIAGAACLTTPLQAYDGCCFGGVTIGVDWLYWTPCTSDQDYALVTETDTSVLESSRVKTKYNCNDWDSGIRVYGNVDNLWNCFGGSLVYTYFNPKATSSVSSEVLGGVSTSFSWPVEVDAGERIKTKWELEYNSIDAVLSYDINVSCNPCLKVEAFSGLTWVSIDQSRKDTIHRLDETSEITVRDSFKRHLDVDAIGPTFGLWSRYRLCDCLHAMGSIQTSLVVGSSRSTDKIDLQSNLPDSQIDKRIKAKDDCYCFPGLHLVAGLVYDVCVCDFELGIRLGWEYVQWINAPTFPEYVANGGGVKNGAGEKNFTMQGIFLGVNASF